MTSVLSPWGIDRRGEQLYRAVLRYPGRHVDDLAAMLGWPPYEITAVMRSLLRTRLIRDAEDEGFYAASPEAAVEGLVAREEHRIGQLRHQLAEVRAAIPNFAKEHREGELERFTPVPLEVVAGDEVGAVVEDLTRTTSGEILVLQPSIHPGLGDRPQLRNLTIEQLTTGRRFRTVYPASVLDDENALAYVRFWGEAGEAARLAAEVPARVIVFGDEAALIPADWGQSSGSDLVVRTPALVAGLRAYAEGMWDAAVPLPRTRRGEVDDERRALLQLLAMGMKDEALARHLGLSLRTVRRRVAELLEELGVVTRFQAGMEAVRRGWL